MKYGVAWLLGVPVSIIALWFRRQPDGLRLLITIGGQSLWPEVRPQ